MRSPLRASGALLLLFALSAPSTASAGIYVQGFGQWMDTDFDNSLGLGGRLGYAFNELHSLEFGYTYTDLDSIDTVYIVDDTEVDVVGTAELNILLLNYRFTYPLTERFRVLAGAGLGATVAEVEVTTRFGSGDGHNGVFTYQFFAGAEYFILPQFAVHAAFRYLSFDDFDYSEDEVTVRVDAGSGQSLELGLTYYF